MIAGSSGASASRFQRWGRLALVLAVFVLLAGLAQTHRVELAAAQTPPSAPSGPGDAFSSGSNPCGSGGHYTAGPYARCDCPDGEPNCPVICWWSNSAQSVLCYPREDLFRASGGSLSPCPPWAATDVKQVPGQSPPLQGGPLPLDGGSCLPGNPPLQGNVTQNGSPDTPPLQGGISQNGSPDQPPINGGVDTGPGPNPLNGGTGTGPGPGPSQPPTDGGPQQPQPQPQTCPDGSQPAPDGSCPAAPPQSAAALLAPAPCADAETFSNTSLGGVPVVPVLTGLCILDDPSVPGFQSLATGCISRFQAATGTQAAAIVAALNAPSPPYWVLVGPSNRGSSGTLALAPSGGGLAPSQTAGTLGSGGANALVLLDAAAGVYKDGLARDPCASLIHELQHAVQINAGVLDNTLVTGLAVADPTTLDPQPGVTTSLPQRELDGVTAENCWRSYAQLAPRQRYFFNRQLTVLPQLVVTPPGETCFPQARLSSMG